MFLLSLRGRDAPASSRAALGSLLPLMCARRQSSPQKIERCGWRAVRVCVRTICPYIRHRVHEPEFRPRPHGNVPSRRTSDGTLSFSLTVFRESTWLDEHLAAETDPEWFSNILTGARGTRQPFRYRRFSGMRHVDCLTDRFHLRLLSWNRTVRIVRTDGNLPFSLPVRPAGPSVGTVPHESPPPVWFDLDSRRRPTPYIFLSPAHPSDDTPISWIIGPAACGLVDGTIFPKTAFSLIRARAACGNHGRTGIRESPSISPVPPHGPPSGIMDSLDPIASTSDGGPSLTHGKG